MFSVIGESVSDVLGALPILLIVYALMYLLETRMHTMPALLEKAQSLGPVFGALAGAVPQCGFSAAASTLYQYGYLAPSTLVAVFISTSDEAIPVLLAYPDALKNVVLLISCKLVLAIAGGYLLQYTVFRENRLQHEKIALTLEQDCGCCSPSAISSIVWRTVKTLSFLLITMLTIDLLLHFVGQDTLAALLLEGSPLQPALCACIGLIPGCATSVFLIQLFLTGTASFGAVLAGLSTGAGFGYVLLLRERGRRKNALKIMLATWSIAVIGGTAVHLLIR